MSRQGPQGARYPDIIVLRGIIGFGSTDPEIRARRLDQRLCAGNDKRLVPRRGRGNLRPVQSLALVEVEDGEAFEESDLARLAIRPGRGLVPTLGREPVGIADGRALLPLADIAAQRLRLSVCQPALRTICGRPSTSWSEVMDERGHNGRQSRA